ncbi:hypothetical protein O181_054442 [Austropuccinia psidii MF-1]|uniref:Uncharacterized protein n=1 Tax=Austropuccinia psidii MF-1 TaxID=1389203 RepID=A0A9Q3EBQ3_9BASI|nr:hypothetical protein [Austropuccinia psidii MF-1]
MEHGQQELQPIFTLGGTESMLPEGMSQRYTLQRSYGNYKRMKSKQAVQSPRGRAARIRENQATTQAIEEHLNQKEHTLIPSGSQGVDKPQLSSGFTPFRNQKISGQESPFITTPGNFKENTRIKGQEQYFSQPKEERIRPNDTEAVGLGEGSTQEPEIPVNTSNITRSPFNRNITPTQMENSVVTP